MKYSPERTIQICKLIEGGVPAKFACQGSDISEAIYFRWKQEKLSDGSPNPDFKLEFLEAIKRAEAKRVETLVEKIRTDRTWTSAAWLLERLHPDDFGDSRLEKRLVLMEQKLEELENANYSNKN